MSHLDDKNSFMHKLRENNIEKFSVCLGLQKNVPLVLKTMDTVYWIAKAGKIGAPFASFYANEPYGYWVLFMELGVLGVIPMIILLSRKARQNENVLILACVLNCTGIFLNRWILSVQTLAVPVLSFDKFVPYHPNWVEFASTFMFVWIGAVVISISYRYLPIFPQEKELNPQ